MQARATATGTQTQQAANAWAAILARRRQQAHGAVPASTSVVEAAAEALLSLFDTAVAQANAALLEAGEEGLITVTSSGHERQYWAIGPDGQSRVISVFLALPVVDGHLCGGVFISSNRSRLSMYLAPTEADGQVRWFVPDSDREFTSDLVHDLFLSVFTDDPSATRRLSPLSGSDLFETPWS